MDNDVAAYCTDQVRRFDHDRYLCALFAPEAARAYILALYAFNVEVAKIREVVTEPIMGQIRLQWWREIVEGAPRGDLRKHPVALGLSDTIRERGLTHEPFERLLTAREFDLTEEAPANLDALESYADATAATLVQLALEALAQHDEASRVAGRHIGIAWALTGLLRAVPFHANRRRLYLPADLLAQHGIAPDRLFEGRAGDALRPVAQTIVERARTHLRDARALRSDVPRGALAALLPATLADIYLNRIERAGFRLFDPALQRPAGERALRLGWSALRGRF